MCFDIFWLRLCAKAMVSLNWIDVKKEIQDKEQHRFDTKPPSPNMCFLLRELFEEACHSARTQHIT